MTVDSSLTSQTSNELKPGWRTVRFDAMAENINDRVDDPAEAGVEYYVGLEHLDPESLKIRRWGKPTDVEATKLRFKPGDIIFGRRRAYQRKLAVAEFEGICSAHALVLRARKDVVLPEFLPFFMQSDAFFERAMSISVGSLSPTINWKTLAAQEFALPPRNEQRRIAEILWAADEATIQADLVVDNIETSNQALFHSILKEGLTKGTVRSSKLFGTIPIEWPEVMLEEICEKITDGEHVTPPRQDEGIFLLSARNVHNGKLDFSVVDYISEETYARLTKRILPEEGDILISCSGTIGRVCQVPPNTKLALVRSVAILKPRERVVSDYLEKCLRSKYLQKQISAGTSQLAQGNLFQGAIRKLTIPLPTVEQQLQIANLMNQFDRTAQHWQFQVEATKQIKRRLLKELLPS